MLQPAYFEVDVSDVKARILNFVKRHRTFAFFDSHGHQHGTAAYHGNRYSFVAMAGVLDGVQVYANAIDTLNGFITKHQQELNWIGCALSYDLKNELEALESSGSEAISFPLIHCFVPEIVFTVDETGLLCVHAALKKPEAVFSEMMGLQAQHDMPSSGFQITRTINKQAYQRAFNAVMRHLQRGDIYEATLCQQAIASFDDCDPTALFRQLCKNSPNPFSVLYQNGDLAVVCASPERFIQHDFDQLTSQPMKGTARRSILPEEDSYLKENLAKSPKERSENVMIVDLVRNDLSKVASRGSVQVKELFGFKASPPRINWSPPSLAN